MKRKTQSSDCDCVRTIVLWSDAAERSATFIVTVNPPSGTAEPSRKSISGPTDTDWKSAAGSFALAGSGGTRRGAATE